MQGLSEPQILTLVKLAGSFRDEAEACAATGQWRAALIFLGSALEAGLLATPCRCEVELRRNGRLPRTTTPLAHYTLGDLLDLAHSAGWTPRTLRKRADLFAVLDGGIGDAAQFLLRVRNAAVHPGNYVRTLGAYEADFQDPEHMKPTYDIFLGITDDVFRKLTEVLHPTPVAATQ